MSQVTLNVEGMSCGGCLNKVEGGVSQLNGVESVKGQIPEGTVNVTFNDSTTNLAEIKGAIQDTGYAIKEDTDK